MVGAYMTGIDTAYMQPIFEWFWWDVPTLRSNVT